MLTKGLLGISIIWAMLIFPGFSAPFLHKAAPKKGKPDTFSADEMHLRYPALDLEDLCKPSENPKCEAVVDAFCLKSCTENLCASRGSIRGMCRLMCEAEDLPASCLKMGPTRKKKPSRKRKKHSRGQQAPGSPPTYFYAPPHALP